jgi:hypothetical protein
VSHLAGTISDLAGFPNVSGSVQADFSGAKQTGASFSLLDNYGLGKVRGFAGCFDADRGYLTSVCIGSSPVDLQNIGDLQNQPPGPLYFRAITP